MEMHRKRLLEKGIEKRKNVEEYLEEKLKLYGVEIENDELITDLAYDISTYSDQIRDNDLSIEKRFDLAKKEEEKVREAENRV